ncbi:hypothetical protein UT300013_35410 [Paraclostridium sordellii]
MVDYNLKFINIREWKRLTKSEYRVMTLVIWIILEYRTEDVSKIIMNKCCYTLVDMEPKYNKSLALKKDLENGLKSLVRKGILDENETSYWIKTSNITSNEVENSNYLSISMSYLDYLCLSKIQKKQLIAHIFKYMLYEFSELDFHLTINFFRELDEYEHCENIVRMTPNKKWKLIEKFECSEHSIKKSIMKLKKAKILNQRSYNKFKVIPLIRFINPNFKSQPLNKD